MITDVGLIGICVMLGIAIGAFGTALAQGKVAAAAMESIARQPEAAGDIRTTLIISLAFIEALTIYVLLIAFMVLGKM